MELEPINYGAAPNDGTGDSLREAMRKTQANFEFLDQSKADAQATALALQSKVTAEAGKSLMTDAEHQKLSGIAAGAQVNAPTNLALGAATANAREITSSTGGSVTLPAATSSTAGLMTAAESTKLGTVATNASANSSDAFLLNRANHSGTQPLSTITGAGTAASMNAVGSGGIIESGSNANGSYLKLADGTLECANIISLPAQALASSVTFLWSYPFGFLYAPFVIAVVTSELGAGSQSSVGILNKNGLYLSDRNPSGVNVNSYAYVEGRPNPVEVMVLAKGRWKA